MQLIGITILEVALHNLHGFYVDDIRLIIKANQDILSHCRDTLDNFGDASNLYCDWSKTMVVLLAPGLLLAFLATSGWEFESQDTSSKYLGISMANQVSIAITKQHLLEKLQKRLDRAVKNPATLSGRVTIANHMILVVLWYMLLSWVGSEQDLDEMEGLVTRFIWTQNKSKRHKVDHATIILPKHKGGLGLISLCHQVYALATKLIVWAISDKDHPLKSIIQHKL